MAFKKLAFTIIMLLPMAARGNDCIDYKLNPRITLDIPAWSKEVVQPLAPMDFLHGNVVATLVDNYDIVLEVLRTFLNVSKTG